MATRTALHEDSDTMVADPALDLTPSSVYMVHVRLQGHGGPYSASRDLKKDNLPDMGSADNNEKAYWRKKAHAYPDGRLFIPGTAFKQAVDTAAKKFPMSVPGGGRSKFGNVFLSGYIPTGNLDLDQTVDDLQPDEYYVNSDGVRGSGKRVWRTFPRLDPWSGEIGFLVTDVRITPDIFRKHLDLAGKFVGVGRWRIEKGGQNGRFEITGFTIGEVE